MEPRLKSYLRSYRLRWGLTQAELAYLAGLKSGSVVSRIERQKRQPGLMVALAFQVVFGAAPLELFPGIYSEIEDAVMRRAYALYENLQGTPSKTTRTKLDLLEDMLARASARHVSQNI
jgi:transcriptional regulator with XRE-family HTH domain